MNHWVLMLIVCGILFALFTSDGRRTRKKRGGR